MLFYFSLCFLTFGLLAVARTWKNFHSFEVRFLPFSSYIPVYILGSCKQFVRLHYAALFSKKKNTRKYSRQKLGKVEKLVPPRKYPNFLRIWNRRNFESFLVLNSKIFITFYYTQTWPNRQLNPQQQRKNSFTKHRTNKFYFCFVLHYVMVVHGCIVYCILRGIVHRLMKIQDGLTSSDMLETYFSWKEIFDEAIQTFA